MHMYKVDNAFAHLKIRGVKLRVVSFWPFISFNFRLCSVVPRVLYFTRVE